MTLSADTLTRLARDQPRAAHAVAADVHERAAVERRVQAHVGVAGEREREARAHEPHVADRSLAEQLEQARGLRAVAPHERLAEHEPGGLGDVERLRDARRPAVHRLLAEHVLAGPQRAQRPVDVHAVGQRDVDRLDVGVGEQVLVGAVRARDPVQLRERLRRRRAAARHGDDVRRGALARALDDRRADARRREDAPAAVRYPLARPSPHARPALRAAAPRDRVDGDGEQQHEPGDDELRPRAQAEQAQAVGDAGDHERAEQRGLDVPAPAEQRRAADDRRGDRVQEDLAAARVRVDRAQPRGEHDAADGRHQRADREAGDADPVDVDARAPRRLGVAADRVDVAPEARAPQDVGPEDEQHADEHGDVRQAAILVDDVDDERQRDEQAADPQRDDEQRVVRQAGGGALAQPPDLHRGVRADDERA